MLENDCNIVTTKRYADFKNTRQNYRHVFPTDASLRHYVFYAETNGLANAISRLANSKKLVFDLDKLDMWIACGGSKS